MEPTEIAADQLTDQAVEEQSASLDALLAEAEATERKQEDEAAPGADDADIDDDGAGLARAQGLIFKGTSKIESALLKRHPYLDLTEKVFDPDSQDVKEVRMSVVAVEVLTPLALQLGFDKAQLPEWAEKYAPAAIAAFALGGMALSIRSQIKAEAKKQAKEADTGPVYEGQATEMQPQDNQTRHESDVLRAQPLGA